MTMQTMTDNIRTGCGTLQVTRERDSGRVVCIVLGRSGTCARAVTHALAGLIRLAQDAGVEDREIREQLEGIACPGRCYDPDRRMWLESCIDALAQVMREK